MQEAEQFKGRLGFQSRSETLLNQGLVQAVDMLDDYGHAPSQINTRAASRIELESDQYRVVLRLRRLPMRMGMQIPADVSAPAIFLDVSIERLYPGASDSEITELLLAVLLRRLTETLSPVVVFWQDAPKGMSKADFLNVFQSAAPRSLALQEANTAAKHQTQPRAAIPRKEPHASKGPTVPQQAIRKPRFPSPFNASRQAHTSAKLFASTAESHHKRQARTSGRGCFASVDAVADDLEQKCSYHAPRAEQMPDQVIDLSDLRLSQQSGDRQHIMTWAATGLVAMLSAPVAVLLLLVELMRASRLKPRVQLMTAAVFVSLLQGAGMVQAAARAFLTPPN